MSHSRAVPGTPALVRLGFVRWLTRHRPPRSRTGPVGGASERDIAAHTAGYRPVRAFRTELYDFGTTPFAFPNSTCAELQRLAERVLDHEEAAMPALHAIAGVASLSGSRLERDRALRADLVSLIERAPASEAAEGRHLLGYLDRLEALIELGLDTHRATRPRRDRS